MKKIALCVKTPVTYNAGSKAVIDATEIALSSGYKKMYYAYTSRFLSTHFHLLNKLLNIILCICASFRISQKHTYFVQWPSPGKSTKILYRTLIRKQAKIVILIHDLNELRGIIYPEDEIIMYSLFDAAETIITHTDSMREYLIGKGVDAKKLKVLYTFDYLTDDIIPERVYDKVISFAGNLLKSTFLQNIHINEEDDIHFYCYGANYTNNNSSIEYKGKFLPNNVSLIHGSWGLVWDGISTESCIGDFGDYLKYNSPHKVSLYIVAELPIIIWKEQALASYITERNLGIAISSIDEIPEKLYSISEAEYQQIRRNIMEEAKELKNGNHLKKFL